LFVQSADPALALELGNVLEDLTEPIGLTTEWDKVREAVLMIVKRKQWKSRISQERVEEIKKPQEVQNNLNPNQEIRIESHPEIQPVVAVPAYMDEIIQGMKDLRLKLTTLEKSNVIKEKQEHKREFIKRCIWCDSLEHASKVCESFQEVRAKNLCAMD
ncbi:hypothetical protein KP509_03G100300, partial [Ceratopteris richardii]